MSLLLLTPQTKLQCHLVGWNQRAPVPQAAVPLELGEVERPCLDKDPESPIDVAARMVHFTEKATDVFSLRMGGI